MGITTPTNGRTDEVPTMIAPEPPRGGRKRILIIMGVVIALLAVIAAAVTVVLVTTKSTTAKVDPVAVYQQKLSNVLAPVVAANQAISVSLQALDGSQTTIRATKTATTNAQQALTSANGAVAIITVPLASTQLSQQAKQALTQENGYLQSVNTTLGDPTGNTVASVQPLASATSSAFVPLASLAPGASTSISGVDNLLKWAAGATAAWKAREQRPTINNYNNTTNVVPQQTPTVVVPSTGGSDTSSGAGICADTVGHNDLTVSSGVSCAFAKDVLIAAARYYQSNGNLPDGVSLSVDGSMVNYAMAGDTLSASSSDGGDISFSGSLANGTGPN
jgi:hypothetical protein